MKILKWIIALTMALQTNGQVVINEFMASNTSTIKDNFDQYDDWIELYNKTGAAIDISSWSISDSIGDLRKWKFKRPTVIPAYSYFMLWADGDTAQGNTFHTNFKLSSKGEMIVLVDSLKKIVDSITYGAQITDKSTARNPNGTGSFVISTPTYNASNGTVSISFKSNEKENWVYLSDSKTLWYSNPGFKGKAYFVTNTIGKIVKKGMLEKQQIDLSSLIPGMYYLKSETEVLTFIIAE